MTGVMNKGASIYDVRKIFGFFRHSHKSADFVPFVCFFGTPPLRMCAINDVRNIFGFI